MDLDGIDVAIVDQIRQLNRMGLVTFASCAGHPWDPAGYPYVAFRDHNPVFAEIAKWAGFDVSVNDLEESQWKMAIYHNKPADTTGFVSKLNALITHCVAITKSAEMQQNLQKSSQKG